MRRGGRGGRGGGGGRGSAGGSGESDIESLSSKFQRITFASENRDVNILLLGETGVGKSTFINAFFNYLEYPTLKKARDGKFVTLIPAKFTITDENYEEKIIQVGKDENEMEEVGVSATQSCRSYVYPVDNGKFRIRLIDTPGIGDTRGINQDNVNFENVLSFIGEMKHLNAICILLKPNNARLTVMFEFCIKQLLSRLEKSASKNLIFVFTNTRSTFYRPGETMPALKKLLGTIQGVQIPLQKENVFCTDNESFRFLAAVNNGLKFSSIDVDNFAQSWLKSVEECNRMITYIAGDSNNIALVPHEVKNTISVNEARRLIVQLSQPLADIAELIQDNIRVLERHKSNLHQSNVSLQELKSKLFIPVVNLRVIPMDQPTTVCTSPKCSTLYKVGDKQKWHYHQKCHCPCYLKNVPKEIVGSPELASCSAMNNQGVCNKCSCRFQVHMHIYYETETYDDRKEDSSLKSVIMDKELALIQARNLIVKISRRVEEYKQERECIIKTTAKFACFLKVNAIAPYNDAYQAYLEYLMDRERSMGDAADYDMIEQFKRMLLEYNEEKTTLLRAINQNASKMEIVTADDIMKSVNTLYNLQHNGSKIKQLFLMQKGARKDENRSDAREYVYKHDNALHIKNKRSGKVAKNKNFSPRHKQNHSRSGNRNPNGPQMNHNYSGPSNQQHDNAHPHVQRDLNTNQYVHIKRDDTGNVDIHLGQTNRSRRPQYADNYSHGGNPPGPHYSSHMQQDPYCYPGPNRSNYPDFPPPYQPQPNPPYHQRNAPNSYQNYNPPPHFQNQPPPLLRDFPVPPSRGGMNYNPHEQQRDFNPRFQKSRYANNTQAENKKWRDPKGYQSDPEYVKEHKSNKHKPSANNSRRHNLDDSSSDSDDSQYFSSTNNDRSRR